MWAGCVRSHVCASVVRLVEGKRARAQTRRSVPTRPIESRVETSSPSGSTLSPVSVQPTSQVGRRRRAHQQQKPLLARRPVWCLVLVARRRLHLGTRNESLGCANQKVATRNVWPTSARVCLCYLELDRLGHERRWAASRLSALGLASGGRSGGRLRGGGGRRRAAQKEPKRTRVAV